MVVGGLYSAKGATVALNRTPWVMSIWRFFVLFLWLSTAITVLLA